MESQTSIGETLRQKRNERGLSVEQAAFQGKVPLRLVQALESDDYHLFPDPRYLIRHLHDYAVFLGVDPEVLETEFREVLRRPQPALVPPPAPRPPIVIAWRQVLWTVAILIVATPAVFIALSLATKRAADRQPEPSQARVEEPSTTDGSTLLPDRVLREDAVASAAVERPPSTASAFSETPSGSAVAPTPPPPPAPVPAAEPGKQVLVVRAQEKTWMSVQADRGERKQVLLQPGQVTEFRAEERLHLIVGNAGGVTLTLNGTVLPALGPSGAVVRDIILPRRTGDPDVTPVRAPAQR